jgi:hypothetical protein
MAVNHLTYVDSLKPICNEPRARKIRSLRISKVASSTTLTLEFVVKPRDGRSYSGSLMVALKRISSQDWQIPYHYPHISEALEKRHGITIDHIHIGTEWMWDQSIGCASTYPIWPAMPRLWSLKIDFGPLSKYRVDQISSLISDCCVLSSIQVVFHGPIGESLAYFCNPYKACRQRSIAFELRIMIPYDEYMSP